MSHQVNLRAVRQAVLLEHPGEVIPDRETVQKGLQRVDRVSRPYFTRYEWTQLLAARVQQLKAGAAPLVSMDDIPAGPGLEYKVAEKEALQQMLPFIVVRPMPNAEPEYWSAQELRKIH